MNAIKKARRLILAEPASPASMTLSRLVLSLESDTPFLLSELYQLDLKSFELAMAILDEWRLDRYYAGKARLFDVSLQASEMQASVSRPA